MPSLVTEQNNQHPKFLGLCDGEAYNFTLSLSNVNDVDYCTHLLGNAGEVAWTGRTHVTFPPGTKPACLAPMVAMNTHTQGKDERASQVRRQLLLP